MKKLCLLVLVVALVACSDDDSNPSSAVPVESCSGMALSSAENAAISSSGMIPQSSSDAALLSSSAVLSSSSLACVTSVDANITISSIGSMNVSCGASTEGWKIYNTDNNTLMTCSGGTWTTSVVVLCEVSSSSSSAVESNVSYGSMTDTRDGKSYKTIIIGGVEWMAENLNFSESSDGSVKIDSSFCYNNLSSNCTTYGRLYQMFSLTDACPIGWHVPESTEWSALRSSLISEYGVSAIGDAVRTGLWENWTGSNLSGFSALPGGWRQKNGVYSEMSEKAFFWGESSVSENGWALDDFNTFSENSRIYVNASFSLRCVKD